jgi:hypothetical protein
MPGDWSGPGEPVLARRNDERLTALVRLHSALVCRPRNGWTSLWAGRTSARPGTMLPSTTSVARLHAAQAGTTRSDFDVAGRAARYRGRA